MGVIAATVPVTRSPVFKILNDSSSISAKDCSISIISSLILLLTSFIIHPGVDAPAVIPSVPTDWNRPMSMSRPRSACTTMGQRRAHSWVSLLVLELF